MSDETILTESSVQQLRAELDFLKGTKRRELSEALRRARSYGDLAENFEYHAAKREQAILNGRIADIEDTLDRAVVVPDGPAGGPDAVSLGCIVRVRDLDEDEEWEFTVVDPVQADPINDRISLNSPVGQALAGAGVGATVEVKAPAGVSRYEVLAIRH
ncbi:MAG: transcription elongation factor GreA [Armatimonadetes bacterium]|nr:transcription elongation factor GreA [Armatimonadota bacterium]